MSWQSYIDTMKTADQSGMVPVAEAAICGIAAGQESVWVSTSGLQGITVDEIKKLGSKDRSSFAQNGVYIGGTRCRLIRDQMDMDPVFALDLKTAADADGNAFGVCVGKTKTAVVIAKGTKDASGGQISNKLLLFDLQSSPSHGFVVGDRSVSSMQRPISDCVCEAAGHMTRRVTPVLQQGASVTCFT
uniref:Profilin n=1 Tax=Xiphophorus maculatus TaxID=8083 RepID=A0A3B5QUY8_XIPMA